MDNGISTGEHDDQHSPWTPPWTWMDCNYRPNRIVRPYPIGSVCMPYMVTFTMNIPQMLAYIPYMDSLGMGIMDNYGPNPRNPLPIGSHR